MGRIIWRPTRNSFAHKNKKKSGYLQAIKAGFPRSRDPMRSNPWVAADIHGSGCLPLQARRPFMRAEKRSYKERCEVLDGSLPYPISILFALALPGSHSLGLTVRKLWESGPRA
jgi:hypothetical protein